MKKEIFNYFQVRGISRPGDMRSLVCKTFATMSDAREFANELAAKSNLGMIWINSFHHQNTPEDLKNHPGIFFHVPGDQPLRSRYIKAPKDVNVPIARQK